MKIQYEKVRCSVCGKVNIFTEPKAAVPEMTTIYPEFCPDLEVLEKQEVENILQECKYCGYTFTRIDENMNLTKQTVGSMQYTEPFGSVSQTEQKNDRQKNAEKCMRAAITYQMGGCERFAAKWYLYAGLLVENERLRRKCFEKTLIYLCKNTENPKTTDFSLILAYLNVMRLLEMFENVIEDGTRIIGFCSGINQKLVKKLISLAEEKDADYYSYFQML